MVRCGERTGTKALTDRRDGFPVNWSFDRARELGWYGDGDGQVANWFERVGSTSQDGALIGSMAHRMRTSSPHDRRPAPRFAEALTAARAVALLSRSPAALTSRERPDFEARLSDGSLVGIECSDVGVESWYSGALQEVEIAIREGIDASADIDARDSYVSIGFDLPLTASRRGISPLRTDPGELLPRGGERVAFVREVLAFYRSGEHRQHRSLALMPADRYPTAARFGARIHASEISAPRGYFCVEHGAVAFDGEEAVNPTLARLSEKVAKAEGYDWDGPLWLALELVDRRHPLNNSLERVYQRRGLDIGRYEVVVVLYEGFGVALSADGGAQRLSISGSRGEPFPEI